MQLSTQVYFKQDSLKFCHKNAQQKHMDIKSEYPLLAEEFY